jgi:hypothetical protein
MGHTVFTFRLLSIRPPVTNLDERQPLRTNAFGVAAARPVAA